VVGGSEHHSLRVADGGDAVAAAMAGPESRRIGSMTTVASTPTSSFAGEQKVKIRPRDHDRRREHRIPARAAGSPDRSTCHRPKEGIASGERRVTQAKVGCRRRRPAKWG
jgi:hypothetical protein